MPQDITAYLARIIGWSDPAAIDRAALLVQLALERVLPLVIAGTDDLPPIAQEIHRRSHPGPVPPFVVCDPRRRGGDTPDTVRTCPGCCTTDEAIAAARGGGTICVTSRRVPGDFLAQRTSARSISVFVCRDPAARPALYEIDAIQVPRLRNRTAQDRAQVVRETANEHELSASGDLAWLLERSSDTHAELQKGCIRLQALHVSATLAAAADKLGMAPVSLDKWLRRRGTLAGQRSIIEPGMGIVPIRRHDVDRQVDGGHLVEAVGNGRGIQPDHEPGELLDAGPPDLHQSLLAGQDRSRELARPLAGDGSRGGVRPGGAAVDPDGRPVCGQGAQR
jgi:hypothetical protein